ncbi:MAG TPA: DUF808 domain-containing protein [Methylotenera sp.]|nr:DUF808 domain-containing protein [Methylotenera sp.]HPH05573.1 DUF808 domain-containing protein [Methylotenera sp.]HPN00013.1 DUF808 domain-containing protein [Methylotenera sp.]
MAAGSLLALLDDIATILDDVSVMTKVAAKKTAGVLGDDLALNAQQVSGVNAERELPVVWAVAKGSFINKLILVPAALAISYFIPWLITPLLMVGGAYLCFEGAEKLAHKFLHSKHEDAAHEKELAQAVADPNVDLVALEKDKIKGAIRTDFILSAEIIVIALGTVATASFSKQVTVVSLIALVMTIGVYGLVAGIVKLDDLGLYMMLRKGKSTFKQIIRKVGSWLLNATPYLMRFLSIAGTAAMFLVGGSIIGHGIPALHHLAEPLKEISFALPMLLDAIVGLLVGAICVVIFTIISKFLPKKQH